jgi:hypothetical protein
MDMVLIKIATFDGTSLREYKLPFSEQLLLDTSSFLSALVMKILALLLPVASFTLAHPSSPKPLSWEITPTNSQQQFRGLSPVNEKVVWISGTNGTVLRTTDSGSTWTNVSPKFAATENASDFQFRDIQAFSRTTAVTLSIGEGNLSRIYITSDGGKNWKRTFVNEEETAFYDCMSFETRKGRESHGVAMSDPVQGKFRLLRRGMVVCIGLSFRTTQCRQHWRASLVSRPVGRVLRLRRVDGIWRREGLTRDVSFTLPPPASVTAGKSQTHPSLVAQQLECSLYVFATHDTVSQSEATTNSLQPATIRPPGQAMAERIGTKLTHSRAVIGQASVGYLVGDR